MNFDKFNFDKLNGISRQDILDALGLSPSFRDYVMPALGVFTAGLAVGAGLALLLAPKSGAELRADISDEFRARLDSIESRLKSESSESEEAEIADEEVSDDEENLEAA